MDKAVAESILLLGKVLEEMNKGSMTTRQLYQASALTGLCAAGNFFTLNDMPRIAEEITDAMIARDRAREEAGTESTESKEK